MWDNISVVKLKEIWEQVGFDSAFERRKALHSVWESNKAVISFIKSKRKCRNHAAVSCSGGLQLNCCCFAYGREVHCQPVQVHILLHQCLLPHLQVGKPLSPSLPSGEVYVPCICTHARWELLQESQVFVVVLCDVFPVLIISLVCWSCVVEQGLAVR